MTSWWLGQCHWQQALSSARYGVGAAAGTQRSRSPHKRSCSLLWALPSGKDSSARNLQAFKPGTSLGFRQSLFCFLVCQCTELQRKKPHRRPQAHLAVVFPFGCSVLMRGGRGGGGRFGDVGGREGTGGIP